MTTSSSVARAKRKWKDAAGGKCKGRLGSDHTGLENYMNSCPLGKFLGVRVSLNKTLTGLSRKTLVFKKGEEQRIKKFLK